jgi:hypothetical protein
MEYLMTYGWSILVIAIVISVLFALGIFNSGSRGNTSTCIASSGWLCTTPSLYSSGTLSLILGAFGQPITITGVGCSSNSTVPSSFQSTSTTLSSGQSAAFTTSCPLQSSTIGSVFTGKIWVQYYYNANPSQSFSIVVANIKTSVSSGGIPGGYAAYVPVTITNTQPVATPANFQQVVYFNPTQSSAYTVNGAVDLGNVRFYLAGQELYSWCESGCSNSTSSNAVFWVDLPSGIGASSSVTLNMYFLTNTIEYDGNFAGEAPQLSSSYAKYDNGAKIFSYYNVNPTSTAGWTLSGSAGQTNLAPAGSKYGTTDAYSAANGGGYVNYEYTNAGLTGNFILSFDIDEVGGSPLGEVFFATNSVGQGQIARVDGRGSTNYDGIIYSTTSWSSFVSISETQLLTSASSTWYKGDVVMTGTSASFYVGPASNLISTFGSLATTSSASPNGGYIGLQGDAGSGTTYVNGFVARLYPPLGVMPSISIGSLTH